MGWSSLVRITIGTFLLAGLSLSAHAKNCKKGIPCGNSCIAVGKTCRIGSGTSSTYKIIHTLTRHLLFIVQSLNPLPLPHQLRLTEKIRLQLLKRISVNMLLQRYRMEESVLYVCWVVPR